MAFLPSPGNMHISDQDGLRHLRSVVVLPEKFTERSRIVMTLKRIASIVVRDVIQRDGHRYYTIDMCFKYSHSRIPTNNQVHSFGLQPCVHQPDARIERRFSEFRKLRDAVFYQAHACAGMAPCQFCKLIVDYVILGDAQPRVYAKWFSSTRNVCQVLNKFIRDLLTLTLYVNESRDYGCPSRDLIPELVEEFLLSNCSNDPTEEP